MTLVTNKAVPDFGSDSGRKTATFTNPAKLRLQPKYSQISVFGQICKMAHTNTATSFEKLHS